MSLSALLDVSKTSLFISLASIMFNPTAWNIIARNGKPDPVRSIARSHHHLLPIHPLRTSELLTDQLTTRKTEYRNKTITRLFGGNAHLGCYVLGACIFSAGIFRNYLHVPRFLIPAFHARSFIRNDSFPLRYLRAILEQPHAHILPAPLDTLVPIALFVLGQTFVFAASWALGVTGRFLGDYFGILMDHRVEGFPFNVLRNPMYVGSTMCFAATALWCVLPRRKSPDMRG
jgi:methylene-fatty-acyl-phospholipid synthase